jgi:hypothetical protein
MKKLILILVLSAFSFAQTPASNDTKKEDAGCCASMKCCENMKKEKDKDAKGGCCGGDAKEGGMCSKPKKEENASEKSKEEEHKH